MKDWSTITPQGRPFVKMQGLSNHFVIVDGREVPFKPSVSEIEEICDVRVGVGAEELLVIEPVSEKGVGAYARVRIYNPDGVEAEACGNATRCAALLLFDESGLDALALEINFEVLHCKRDGDNISAEMGKISFDWDKIPLAEECDTLDVAVGAGGLSGAVAVNVANPHLVYFIDGKEVLDFVQIGSEIQKNSFLPESANIGFAEVVSDTHIKLQVYERPGVLTMACGSGSCAAVAAARARNLINSDFATVEMPGGSLKISYKDDISPVMSGPAEYCYSGILKI